MLNYPNLAELPVEVFLDHLLPYVQVLDLLRLASTSKFFAVLCSDDRLWKRKLQSDFNFSGERTARTSGWKFIYRGLFKPRVFVWGAKANGSLGDSYQPESLFKGVPFPTQMPLPGVRVVSLVAGFTSFHALDSDGVVHIWGTLDNFGSPSPNSGFSKGGKQATTPLKLGMPFPIRSVSCGRLHSSCLDHTNAIWIFTNWGRPFRLSSPLLDSDPGFVPRQIECGLTYTSLLTNSGDVFVWWPFMGEMAEIMYTKNEEMDRQGDKDAFPTKEGVIPCVTWNLAFEPTRLPVIPPLPDLLHTGREKSTEVTKLIQIAAFDVYILGLTNHGHVLKFGTLWHDEASVRQRRWDYLPLFSEAKKVAEHSVFSDRPGINHIDPPQTLQITHISAHSTNFSAYSTDSTSIVLLGTKATTAASQPNIIPALQNKSVISVVMGQHHHAALTADGKLFTWGYHSHGALGLGDPLALELGSFGAFATAHERDIAISEGSGHPLGADVPTEVRFDHIGKKPKDRFCFAATASGWHTGALVIDLEPDEEDGMEGIRLVG